MFVLGIILGAGITISIFIFKIFPEFKEAHRAESIKAGVAEYYDLESDYSPE